jgi:hypothetical protein
LAALALCSCGSSAPPRSDSGDGGDAASPETGASPESAPTTDAATEAESSTDAGPTVTATVTVDPTTITGTVDPGFVGLSYEKAHMTDGFLTGTNAPLVALLTLLGPSVLRIGANTVDETTWTPAGPGSTAGEIAKPDVDAFASLVKTAGWTSIYAVNLKTSTASVAADEATYAAGALGASLSGLEIGNEPDLYMSTALEPNWDYDAFKTEWESFATAIRTAVPGAPLTGPATAFDTAGFTVPFAADEAANIVLLTQHYYRDNAASPTASIGELLSTDNALGDMLTTVTAAAKKNATAGGCRLAETNSLYNSGKQGVSNSYASALWAIEFMFTAAHYGAAGVNFHGGNTPGWYTPIADANGAVVEARPIFYGMLLFSQAGAGNLDATSVAGGSPLLAHAVAASDGSTRVVLVNESATTDVDATVDLGKAATSATLTRLAGPSLEATSGVTLAGNPISPSGAWNPGPLPSVPVTGSTLEVDVPAASAVLVRAM